MFGNADIPLCYLVQLICDKMMNLQIILKIIKVVSLKFKDFSISIFQGKKQFVWKVLPGGGEGGAYAAMLFPVNNFIIPRGIITYCGGYWIGSGCYGLHDFDLGKIQMIKLQS